MKTAISLPDQLFRDADALASRLGVSRSELFQRAMERLLREHEDAATTAALDAVYGEEPASVAEPLMRMQVGSVSREEW